MTRSRRVRAAGLIVALLSLVASSIDPARASDAASRFFQSSDGVRLHYLEAGRGRTLVFVPGWTMPAIVWCAQIAHFAHAYRVIAFDPRSQGDSAIASSGHDPERRGRDLAELIDHLGDAPVVLVGWSLGVLDALAHLRAEGDRRIDALVLVDNSVGEEPPPSSGNPNFLRDLRRDREGVTRQFVRSMFKVADPSPSVETITRFALRTPTDAAVALLSYPWPRERWREALYSTRKPVLYVVTPRFAGQARNVERNHARATVRVMNGVGHALFIDAAERFNAEVEAFLRASGLQ